MIIKHSTFNTKDDEINIMLEILKNEDTLIGNCFLILNFYLKILL